ncbi:MAG: selenide, water dikinase SelD [Deltaproteobacteria bacterium RIFCSPLOWO2_12_FULL_43_16]|nr:MAG: selenide, water dikinase SelD [Deltaproteobacteria bacterium GWA2_43_19]OGQ11449.1 MAG: selenide, water dikinase SelD [Deltaproteobacteria bacterium RIFCSPHIGHO2_02_FULL_43_33]OGQ36415.1 MAG: selenide, water dikinase SelD [Deltaproteobacteria bacterium RIFCSPLOWO2_01_FULL_42_9]OGQ60518.1 MAG: selenide, water dikinase SelD [Deltaproteobacteria bacterium RIFCSPLOWO2_12_FULL_43_16]
MGHDALAQVLRQLPEVTDKNLLVGAEHADDAGVYKLTDDIAVVNTLDFFPPIIDDPYTFGQIAAANALSDVYAMGGVPRLAMNIVAFPASLDLSILQEIIKGSTDKLKEAGVILVGGHSIEDKEIKYGLSVTGLVHPQKIITNAGAKPRDKLILTKPIGVGVITTALKNGKAKPEDAQDAIESMKALNDEASRIMQEVGVNACTDITGFGLIGHAMEMAEASSASIMFNIKNIPFFPKAIDLVKKSANHPKTIKSNREYLASNLRMPDDIKPEQANLLYDPQTSGGLLISVSPEKSQKLVEQLSAAKILAAIVGEVVEKGGVAILVKD